MSYRFGMNKRSDFPMRIPQISTVWFVMIISETYTKASEKRRSSRPVCRSESRGSACRSSKAHKLRSMPLLWRGGNNVKHGDLEKAMFEPSKDIDVHMAMEGVNMSCVQCHRTEKAHDSGKDLFAFFNET